MKWEGGDIKSASGVAVPLCSFCFDSQDLRSHALFTLTKMCFFYQSNVSGKLRKKKKKQKNKKSSSGETLVCLAATLSVVFWLFLRGLLEAVCLWQTCPPDSLVT